MGLTSSDSGCTFFAPQCSYRLDNTNETLQYSWEVGLDAASKGDT